jgi:3-deoxy-7-phosphoheptulonate synthase
MIVVMERNATEEQVDKVIERLVRCGFDVHRSTGAELTVLGAVGGKVVDTRDFELLEGVKEVVRVTLPYKLSSRSYKPEDTIVHVNDVAIGGKDVAVIAGPCIVENHDQIHAVAEIVSQAGARILRGGAFKSHCAPYAFQGLEEEGLKLLRKAADRYGMQVVSEVLDHTQIPLFLDYVDILQIGARNMQNVFFLRQLGKVRKPILLTRGMSSTVEELLLAADSVMREGNVEIILCERGIRTFENYTRNTLDISAIPVVKKLSHLPILVDPSHGTGRRDKVPPMARAAVAAGADGLMIEVHPDPESALSDGAQSLYPAQFSKLMDELRIIAPALSRTISNVHRG